ncbi:hypothetical protein KHO57_gp090 [Mycobacterium phage Phabba]|uniref:Uncharacterized protein n=1 Tax=Mycobacterium phage Phabba TaxID=2027899 RepID=A0A249XU94_9CAUD|nr:hypothetical protein KHO57_gp090 [Mycobacterium phage Phabba]ASZ74814.1 hypothetical protein SEA_PHABBA_277 [Mycobacterium phage Phabba]
MAHTLVDQLAGTYSPISSLLTPNEKSLLVNSLDAVNESRERAGQNAYLFLFRGSIEDVKTLKVLSPLNDRWWKS